MNSIDRIAQHILDSSYSLIAIDGVDASGKTTFAYQLRDELMKIGKEVIVVSLDNFHQPKSIRYQRGDTSSEGFFYDSYQYEYFIENSIVPFKKGVEKLVVKCFDLDKDIESIEYASLNAGTMLIIEGIFLNRDELYKFWEYSIFLDVSAETSLERNLKRSLESNPNLDIEKYKLRFHKRYKAGQELYSEKCRPKQRSSIVINNNHNLSIQNLEFKISN